MADNVTLPGTGQAVATDDIGGIQYQRVKLALGDDGVAVDASANNPVPIQATGELIEAIEALRMSVQSLNKTVGWSMPDTSGRMRVLAENPTAANLAATVSQGTAANLQATVSQGTAANLQATVSIAASQTLGTVTTCGTLTNQAQLGGFAANDEIPSLMRLSAASLRTNISVT